MKTKTFLLMLCTLFAIQTFCQQQDIYKRKPWEQVEKKFKTSLETKEPALKNKTLPAIEAADNSVVKINMKPTYLGSNGKGAYVFSMMPYKTPCLVPDSTFNSNMPIAKF